MAVIEMQNINKRFGDIQANNDIDISIKSGEIHCLLGENGAGKSTLVKILFGLYTPDSGTIKIKGKNVRFASPSEAIKQGIGMIHQHFMLVDRLSITENIIAGAEIKRG
ncbi:MAG: ATP-binding cassette domain-containing protein, partial [Bacillota bacterium]